MLYPYQLSYLNNIPDNTIHSNSHTFGLLSETARLKKPQVKKIQINDEYVITNYYFNKIISIAQLVLIEHWQLKTKVLVSSRRVITFSLLVLTSIGSLLCQYCIHCEHFEYDTPNIFPI